MRVILYDNLPHQYYYPEKNKRNYFKNAKEKYLIRTLFRRRYFLGCSSVDIASTLDDSSFDADSDILKREFIRIFHTVL
jgi:hypothetical protein